MERCWSKDTKLLTGGTNAKDLLDNMGTIYFILEKLRECM
jgi:hypothetical protein